LLAGVAVDSIGFDFLVVHTDQVSDADCAAAAAAAAADGDDAGAAAARPPLFDVLLRVCRITCTRPHTSPQLDERHDAFVAVERSSGGNGWCRIRRHGLEKVLFTASPPVQQTWT
jgi:hypothetical protein